MRWFKLLLPLLVLSYFSLATAEIKKPKTVFVKKVKKETLFSLYTYPVKIVSEKHYKKLPEGIYQSVLAGIPYDHSDRLPGPGVLSAKFLKE